MESKGIIMIEKKSTQMRWNEIKLIKKMFLIKLDIM